MVVLLCYPKKREMVSGALGPLQHEPAWMSIHDVHLPELFGSHKNTHATNTTRVDRVVVRQTRQTLIGRDYLYIESIQPERQT